MAEDAKPADQAQPPADAQAVAQSGAAAQPSGEDPRASASPQVLKYSDDGRPVQYVRSKE